MPPESGWRFASTAKKLMSLDRPQFAAEFLRRNPDYIKDYRNTQDQIASGSLAHDAGMERLARRWGLSFPA
jgi:hypothetical protein